MNCKQCDKPLSTDELGLNYKLIARDCESFLCIRCLAAYFCVTEEKLHAKIDQFKRQGCLLFTSEYQPHVND